MPRSPKKSNKKDTLQIGLLDFSTFSGRVNKPNAPSVVQVKALRRAVREAGHKPVTYKVEKCQLYFDHKKAKILYNSKKIKGCDVLIPRVIVTTNVGLEVSILKQFQLMGIPVLNGYLPVQHAKNKLRTMQILTRAGLPVPRTVVVRQFKYIDEAIKLVGGYPVILKKPYGSLGSGVVIVESRRSLYSALDILWRSKDLRILLIQEYVAEADGSDYRAFVVGDKVVAGMKRTAQKGDFRSNLHLGGEAATVTLTTEEQAIAIKATQALGLQFAGVDILRSKDGPVIMEVNANPGFIGLMKTTGIDVPGAIVDFAVSYARKKSKARASKKK